MNKQTAEIMRRRHELLAEIGSQRLQIAQMASRWQPLLAVADHGLAGIRFLRSHPVLLGGVVALLVIRRRGLVGLATGSWRLWKRFRYIKGFSAGLPLLF